MKMKTQYTKFVECTKAVLIGTFLAVNAYMKKEERFQINNLTITQETRKIRTKHKAIRKKETTEIRAEINEIENRKAIEKCYET